MRIFFLFLVFTILCSNVTRAKWLEGEIAVFQGLDKITARIKTLEFKVGRNNSFGILDIYVKRCVYSKPIDTPESIAYVNIVDNSKKQFQLRKTNIVFHGWMFASSPALNAMEHPVYDLVLIACKKFKTDIDGSTSGSSKE